MGTRRSHAVSLLFGASRPDGRSASFHDAARGFPRPALRINTRCLSIGLALALALLPLPSQARGMETLGFRLTGSHAPIQVVVAENFWGSIAKQEGGSGVRVSSIITNPNADPHSYEPTTTDARLVANARYVIFNGAGYDPWLEKLLSANPVTGRRVLDIGAALHKKQGDNPHFWYSPRYVSLVATHITADYTHLDPGHASFFRREHARFATTGLKQYHALISSIIRHYHSVPVGATESIFVYLAQALHLNLISPSGFMKAMAEGSEPTARDKAQFDDQVTKRQIKVLVFNSQNVTPDASALKSKAISVHIPLVAITETLSPASASFQSWQVSELEALRGALHRATGR